MFMQIPEQVEPFAACESHGCPIQDDWFILFGFPLIRSAHLIK